MSNGPTVGRTITLHDVQPITFSIKTEELESGTRMTLECRFQYLDRDGKAVRETGDSWVRGEIPDKWHVRVQQFMSQMIVPMLREETGLDAREG